MITWPEEVVSDIARRNCVLFLGSGVSRNSENGAGKRPKTWHTFLSDLLPKISPNKHIKTLLKEKDLLTACEIIKRELGTPEFTRILREEFLTPGYKAAKIHEAIFKLDSRIVVTPNFDKIYETYANSEANGSITIKHHYDPDVTNVMRGSGRVVLKIHGTIDSPERMIFTRKEYAKARSDHRNFYEIIEALSLTNTFVFIGCGVNDPSIKLLLEDTFFRHPGSRPHIMLQPKGELHKSVIKVVEDTMNLKILPYSIANSHIELMDSLDDLVHRVEQNRDDLRKNTNW